MKVKLTKLARSPDAKIEPGDWKNYVLGSDMNDTSLPVDYTAHGELLEPITVGKTVRINRTHRNNVEIPGYLETSPVVSLIVNGFITRNSIYAVEYL